MRIYCDSDHDKLAAITELPSFISRPYAIQLVRKSTRISPTNNFYLAYGRRRILPDLLSSGFFSVT